MHSSPGERGRRILQAAVGRVCFFERLEGRLLLSAKSLPLWQISSDRGGRAADDVIVVQLDPNDSSRVQALVNGQSVGRRSLTRLRGIRILGGGGNDDIAADLPAGLGVTILGGAGNDTLAGGDGNDRLFGGLGDDEMEGGLGRDVLLGQAGDDLLNGEEGNDRLDGGGGGDTLAGGMGEDRLLGDSGNDQLSGGFGDDVLEGELDKDVLRGGDGADSLDGGAARDVIFREKIDYWHFNRFDITRADRRTNPLGQLGDAQALKQWVIESAVKQWKWAFGKPAHYWWRYPWIYDKTGGPEAMAPTGGTQNTDSPSSHSETNNQVAGVDEADIVKTDGQYIYLVRDNELVILDSWPADEVRIVSRTALEGYASGVYLDGDRLTILSQAWNYDWNYGGPMLDVALLPGQRMIAPYYGRSEAQVKVTVLDVSNRAAPQTLSETTLDGSLTSSRDIDGRLYLVLNTSGQAPEPAVVPADSDSSQKEVYESEASYRARLEAMPLAELLPGFETTARGEDGTETKVGGALVKAEDLWVPADKVDASSLFSVVLFDPTAAKPRPITATSVAGLSGQVYVSTDSLYVTSQSWDSPLGDWIGEHRTDIYKFALGADSIAYEGVGAVPGWVLNQFSMDDDGGNFRIATTTESGGRSNNVFVLQDKGQTLDIVGGLTELAFSERIYAARFVGDRGYLVTFRQTDPLFTLDLSDPAQPELKGVLEIPGYSSYLHPISDSLLIGFGRDGDESGRIGGLQVSLFDVSDLTDPKRLDMYRFDTPADTWSWSAAEWDHHAFNYFAEHQVLALPVLDYGWYNGTAKLEVLKVDPAKGFTSLGRVAQNGQVLRGVQIGDYLYSIGSKSVKVVAIDDPRQEVAVVKLADDSTDDGGGVEVVGAI